MKFPIALPAFAPDAAVAPAPAAVVPVPVVAPAAPVVVAPVVVPPVVPAPVAPAAAPVVETPVVVAPVVPAPTAVVPGKAPDTYDLKAANSALVDASDLEQFAALAKARGWSQDEAQAAVTEHEASLAAQNDRYLTALQAHSEIGGEKLAAAQARATAVLDRFLPATSPEGAALRSGLQKSGYGNFTPLVLLFARIGSAMGEDGNVAASVGGGKRSHADVLFGDAKP